LGRVKKEGAADLIGEGRGRKGEGRAKDWLPTFQCG